VLSYMLQECPANVHIAHEAGILPDLVTHLESPTAGLRAVVANMIHDMCMASSVYRDECVRLGGLPGIVRQLNSPPDAALDNVQVQLESILTLEDLIMDENDSLIAENARKAISAGAEGALEHLVDMEDEDVYNAASMVLGKLASLKRKDLQHE